MASLGELVVDIIANTQQYNKDITKAQKTLTQFGKDAEKVGKNLTRYVTLPILAVGVASIKLASDAEESRAKFNTAFKGIEDRATETAQTLAREYGLATQTSEKLLGDTGDLLKGFGATADGALDFSLEIQKLSVDLASYNNVQGGASRVSNILTKSVLGNKDGLSELGVSLLDVDIKQELVRTGQDKLVGQAGKLAKAQATFNLILQQTGDAQGDYARTSDSVANQTKLVIERTKDLAVEFGTLLLPVVSEILEKTNDLVEYFTDLDDGTKKTIITIAAFSAGLGPAILGVTKLGKALKVISGATGGIGLAIVAVTALVAGIKAWNKVKLERDYGDVSKNLGISAEKAKKITDHFTLLRSAGADWARSVNEIKEDYELSDNEVIKLLANSKELSDVDEKKVSNLNAQISRWEELNSQGTAQLKLERMAAKEKQDALDAEKAKNAELKAIYDELKASQDAQIGEVLNAHRSAIQVIDDEIKALQDLKVVDSETQKSRVLAIKQLEADKTKIREDEEAEVKKANEAIDALNKESLDRFLDSTQTELEALKRQKDEAISIAKEQGLETANIEKYYNNLILKNEEETSAESIAISEKEFKDKIDLYSTYANQVFSIVDSIIQLAGYQSDAEIAELEKTADTAKQLNEERLNDLISTLESELELKLGVLNAETQAETALAAFKAQLTEEERLSDLAEAETKIATLLATGSAEDAEEARKLQRDIDNDAKLRELENQATKDNIARIESVTNAEDAANAEKVRIEEEAAKEKARIDKELAEKRYALELAQFRANKVSSAIQAGINTAVAVTSFLYNPILAAIVGLAGAAQVATIVAQPDPPRPQLAQGAFISATQRGTEVIVGEDGDEEIFGMGSKGIPRRAKFANEVAGIVMAKMGNTGQSVVNNFYGKSLLSNTELAEFAKQFYPSQVKEQQRRGLA